MITDPEEPISPPEHPSHTADVPATPRRILVVEDSKDLAQGLADNLKMEGYQVEVAHDGERALEVTESFGPHLVVLDLMLPGMGGFEFLEVFRSQGRSAPVLILSARSEQMDKLRGFRSGADDFVTKPFDLFELLARIEVILRRSQGDLEAMNEVVRFGDVTLDMRARTVHRGEVPVELSPKELGLAIALVRRPGEAIARDDLLREVWGYKAAVRTRTVDTHMLQLRKKLEPEPGAPKHFHTVPKFGYRFEF